MPPVLLPVAPENALPLFDVSATRQLEALAAAHLPAYTLMQRAGMATARLACALAPHARTVWIACGSGNNGGDGLEAALQLHLRGWPVQVTWLGDPHRAPPDALRAWQRANQGGVCFTSLPPSDLGPQDLCIDALLGIGVTPSSTASRESERPERSERLRACQDALQASVAPVLCVDVPSGLASDSGQYVDQDGGQYALPPRSRRYTLSLLTLKPGLFTAVGRDAAGQVWLDDLGLSALPSATLADAPPPCAWLGGAPAPLTRPHASHKGDFGDVAIVGGEALARRGLGMSGAALLAARAALHAGAGRVLVALLNQTNDANPANPANPAIHALEMAVDTTQPELMLRRFEALRLPEITVVCGCGGGQAVAQYLPIVLAQVPRLVLDADALNALAADPTLNQRLQERHTRHTARTFHADSTVLTPHPLEAARLLGWSTAQVQAQRLPAAQVLAQRYGCTVVLKGSGSVIAAPGRIPHINPTGNARLASAGTGDVLAGLIGAYLAAGLTAFEAALRACWRHGHAADTWPADSALTASGLAQRMGDF